MSDADTTQNRARRPPAPRRVAAVVAAGLVLGGATLGLAALLDDPEGRAARDPAPIIVGRVPVEQATRAPRSGVTADLPPLSMVLDRPAPEGISSLPAAQQVQRLRDLVAAGAPPRRRVELGRALMETGDAEGARRAFAAARAGMPGDPAPLVGLAMTEGLRGEAGVAEAGRRMGALTRRFPRSQLVWFNRGWIAAYARDADAVVEAWQRTVELDPRTPLGRTADALLARVADSGG
ncbi:MAG TPA: hypothetical protein VNT51_04190 [Miltoncostaeaceae bacterium]|nr:hypothetical protein [Miltoncostaeaceae bacterium]